MCIRDSDRYEKMDSFTLSNIIITSHLPFEDRKKLLFNEKIFSKLNDINITTISVSYTHLLIKSSGGTGPVILQQPIRLGAKAA